MVGLKHRPEFGPDGREVEVFTFIIIGVFVRETEMTPLREKKRVSSRRKQVGGKNRASIFGGFHWI